MKLREYLAGKYRNDASALSDDEAIILGIPVPMDDRLQEM
jgi:hypothetical protein